MYILLNIKIYIIAKKYKVMLCKHLKILHVQIKITNNQIKEHFKIHIKIFNKQYINLKIKMLIKLNIF